MVQAQEEETFLLMRWHLVKLIRCRELQICPQFGLTGIVPVGKATQKNALVGTVVGGAEKQVQGAVEGVIDGGGVTVGDGNVGRDLHCASEGGMKDAQLLGVNVIFVGGRQDVGVMCGA